jgi:PKD domain
MKLLRIITLLILGFGATKSSPVQAQCDGCVSNVTCTADPAYPTLCPVQPPDAIAGEAYSADITFWLPNNFTDPNTGFNVDFMLMTITGVSGLPYGLDITYSEPTGVYYPQENQYGCARICGTPISAGTYTVAISILAGVEYNGFPINAVEQFPLTLVVQPGTSSNTSFTFTPTTGCGTAEVQFDALIDGDGAPVTYAWNLGNGNTSSEASISQTYHSPGTYSISLQTSIGGYVLNNVSVGGVNDNWCGDVEEPSLFGSCTGDPDLYFVLTDGNGNAVTSGTNDNSTSTSWSGANQVLGNPPYSIAFFDEDLISQDDDLGTFNMPQGTSGEIPFTLGNGTFGSLLIDLVTQQVFSDTDTVMVFAAPQPIIAYDTADAQICVSDTGLVGITWFNDGDTVLTGNTCINADSSGTWWAVVNNAFGCANATDTVVICPSISIEQSGDVLFTETGLDNYQWTLNGTPVTDADGPFLVAETGGLYAVSATNMDGCPLQAELQVVIMATAPNDAVEPILHVFPTAASDMIRLSITQRSLADVLDARGLLVMSLGEHATGMHELDISALAPGTYIIRSSGTAGTFCTRFVRLR